MSYLSAPRTRRHTLLLAVVVALAAEVALLASGLLVYYLWEWLT
jgi:hypothetical protein